MKILKIFIVILILVFFNTQSISEQKTDCTKIDNSTLVGNLKYVLCKKNSDKLDKDGNFKKGTFNIFKKS